MYIQENYLMQKNISQRKITEKEKEKEQRTKNKEKRKATNYKGES